MLSGIYRWVGFCFVPWDKVFVPYDKLAATWPWARHMMSDFESQEHCYSHVSRKETEARGDPKHVDIL